MTPRQAEAHRLVIVEGKSHTQAAKQMGVSPERVRQLLAAIGIRTGHTSAGRMSSARANAARWKRTDFRARMAVAVAKRWNRYRQEHGLPCRDEIVAAYEAHGQRAAARYLGITVGQVAGVMNRHRKAMEARS